MKHNGEGAGGKLYTKERGSYEEAEIQRKALRRGKNLFGLQRRYMFRKGKSAVEGDSNESWSGIETEAGVKYEKVALEFSLARIHWEERGLTFARIERKTPVLRPALQSIQSFLRSLGYSRDRRGGPNGQIVSVKRTADGRRQRGQKIINEKRGKYRPKNGFLRNTSTDSRGASIVILINHASALIKKERSCPTSRARREANRNKFVYKGGMPDRVESFREIDSSEDRPRAWPGFVKPIRNGRKKIQNLIECRPFRAETGLARRKNGIGFQKQE